MTMTLISTVTADGSSGTLSLASISATYTDLLVLVSGRNSLETWFYVRPNGSSSNGTSKTLSGSGSAIGSDSWAYIRAVTNYGGRTASTFGNTSIYIPNYAGSTNKSVSVDGVEENNATSAVSAIGAGLWSSTSAITSLDLVCGASGVWASGSTASLYGILKGSGGATVS